MNILIAGDWHSTIHEEQVSLALKKLGHNVSEFRWSRYFADKFRANAVERFYAKVQHHFMFGSAVNEVNELFFDRVSSVRPDALLIYRGTHIYANTLSRIKLLPSPPVLVGYNNDNPFSRAYPRWFWRHFKASIKEYDLLLAYRPSNIPQYYAAGARSVQLMRSWYVPSLHQPVQLDHDDLLNFETDVVFIGHYEPDGRLQMLAEVAKRGYKMRLFGHGKDWNGALRRNSHLRRYVPLRNVWSNDYIKAIGGAKIALCFLSTLNEDSYTRRCFEIPAVGTMLLCQRSEDMAKLFVPELEADYFSSADELCAKIDYYLKNDQARVRVALSGRNKVVKANHDVGSRVQDLLRFIEEAQERSSKGSGE